MGHTASPSAPNSRRALKEASYPGALYTALERLETKGLIKSRMSDPTPQRGGRAKRYVSVTAAGRQALTRARQAYDRMLEGLDFARAVHA